MNRNQTLAVQQVKNATDFILGGWENSILDGEREAMPSHDILVDQIYTQVMTCTTYPGVLIATPMKQIRFAGKKFILEQIEELLQKEGY